MNKLFINGCVQKVCTRNMTSLRCPSSCNTVVTNVEVQDTDFLDTPKLLLLDASREKHTSCERSVAAVEAVVAAAAAAADGVVTCLPSVSAVHILQSLAGGGGG